MTGLRAAERGGVVTVTTEHAGGATGQVALSGTTHWPAARSRPRRSPTPAGSSWPTRHRSRRTPCGTPSPTSSSGPCGDSFAQPIDVHRGVRIQQLLAAVADSMIAAAPGSLADARRDAVRPAAAVRAVRPGLQPSASSTTVMRSASASLPRA